MEINFFEYGSRKPVKDFLEDLQAKERAKVVRNLKLLKKFGFGIGGTFVEPLGNGLFSLKTRYAGVFIRLLFCTLSDNRIMILSGFKKKTNKIPKREINLAKERKKKV